MKKLQFSHVFIMFLLFLPVITLTGCMNADSSTKDSSAMGKEADKKADTNQKFAELEDKFDAQIGIYAIDMGTDQTIEYRPEERFAFTSTYKALAAGTLLQQKSTEELNEVIMYAEDDLVPYSPVTKENVDEGMTLLELSEAAVRTSDNTAGNLLFEALGGPEKFEMALRQIGDNVIEADRYEPELNDFTPGDSRDTSTPRALAASLQAFAVDDLLSNDKRKLLVDWMRGNATGDTLIRAGAPEDWEVVDKSGAGSYGTRNDIAVVWPPNRDPIVMVIMSRHDTEDAEYDDALIEQSAEVIFDTFK